MSSTNNTDHSVTANEKLLAQLNLRNHIFAEERKKMLENEKAKKIEAIRQELSIKRLNVVKRLTEQSQPKTVKKAIKNRFKKFLNK